MQITIKLFANFRTGRFSTATHDCPVDTRIAEVIQVLQIQTAQIGTIMLNNRHAEQDQRLNAGDCLAIFPLLGGG